MALDLTYDPNWKPDSKSGDVDLTYDPNWKPQGILGGLGSSLKRGIDSTVDYGKISLTDNPDEIAGIVSENIRNRPQPSAAQQKMNAEIAPYAKEASDAQGIVGNIGAYAKLYGKRAMQLAENPREFAGMVAENLPNSAPGIAGMVAGGAAGAATPVPFGAAIGGVVGGTAGGYKIEQGSSMFDQVVKEAQARGIDTNNKPAMSAMIAEKYPEFLKASQLKGVGTAGTDAVLNVATLGVAGIGERALAREARSVADLAKAGKMTGEEAASAIAGIEAKNAARNTIGQKALRGAGVAAGEMAGESLSEAAGQQLAYGKLDPLDVVDEGLLAFGQGVGMAAGRKFISPLVGATDKDSVTQEIERARAFATALNQSVGGDVNAVPTLITDLGPLQQRIDDLHGIGNARMNDAERAKYEQEFNAAFGEVVGYTTDKDGMEIPFTMGDYLNSQVRSADITRDRPKAANAAQQSESRLQQVADEETTGYVAPEIPVVGTLSAVANMAIKSGAHAQNQMQQAMQAALAKQGKPEKANGPIAAATDAQVATQGAQGAGGNVPGSAGVSPSALAGNQERAGNGAEVAAPGLRPAVSAGIAGVPAGQLTPEVSRAAQPSQVAAQAAQANGPQARSEQAAAQASAFDVSQRTNGQLSYLASNGQPGWKEAAVAELQKRGVQVSAPQQAKSDTLATTANVNSDRPATADQILSGKKAAYAEMAATGAPDDVVARSVMRWQEQANSRNESMNLWRSENGALGLVPASQKSPFVNGALVTTIHPESSGSANSASVPALKAEDSAKTPAAPVEVNVEVRQNQKAKGEKLIFINGEQVGVVSRARSPGTSDWGFRGSLSGELHFTEEKAVAAETEAAKKHYSNRIKVAAMEAEMPPAAETKPKPENKKPTEPPTFWTSSTPAHRKWIMDASGMKQYTAMTPWNRIKPEHQALLIEQWGDKPANQNTVNNEAPSAATASAESVAKNQDPIKKQDQATDSAPQQKADATPIPPALTIIAERLGVTVVRSKSGFHASSDGKEVSVPQEDRDAASAISADHILAHELGHVVLIRRGLSFKGFPAKEIARYIPNWLQWIGASKEFRPGVWGHENKKIRDHAKKPSEIIADTLGAVMMGLRPVSLLDGFMKNTGTTLHDLGLQTIEEANAEYQKRQQDQNPVKNEAPAAAMVSKETKAPEQESIKKTAGKPRMGESADELIAALKKAAEGVTHEGKILYPTIFVPGMGGSFRMNADGSIEKIVSGGFGITKASEEEINDVQDSITKDQVQVVLRSHWGGSGSTGTTKVVKELHSPTGNSFKKDAAVDVGKEPKSFGNPKSSSKVFLSVRNDGGFDAVHIRDKKESRGEAIDVEQARYSHIDTFSKAVDFLISTRPHLRGSYFEDRSERIDSAVDAESQPKTDTTPEARQDKAQGITPQHVENGKAEPATAAAVEQSLKKGAAHSPLDLRQERDLLLKKVDQAIAAAPTAEEKGAWDRVNQKIDLKNNMHVDDTIGYRMFDVPGDGKFKVLNLKEALQRFRERVEANPGFKKPANTTGLQKVAPWQRTTTGGTEAATKELLDAGEYSAANEYAKQIGKPLIFGQYQDGSAITVYTEAKPFEREGYDDFNMVSVRAVGAADKVAWAVVDLNSGLTVSSKHPTRLKAIAETNKALDKTTPEQMAVAVRSVKANTPGIVGTQEELEQRWLANVEQREAEAQGKADQEHRRTLRSSAKGMLAETSVGKEAAKQEDKALADDISNGVKGANDPARQAAVVSEIENKAGVYPGAKAKPFPLDFTPKQYHEARLKWMAERNGVPLAEVRENYDTDAGRKESDGEWVDAVRQAFKDGKPLTRQTLDKLHEVRPGAVQAFMHDYPEAKIPDGYQTPVARKEEQKKAEERKEDRAAIKSAADTKKQEEAKPAEPTAKAPTAAEKRKTLDDSLRAGSISVDDYMKAVGLTDDDIGFLSANSLREQAGRIAKERSPYHQAINKVHAALSEQMQKAMDSARNGPQQRKSREERIARITRDRETLDMLARKYEHPFKNDYVSKLSDGLHSRFASAFDKIKTGSYARDEFNKDSYGAWAELLIEAANKKQGTEQTKPAEDAKPANKAEAIGDFGEKIGGAKKDLWTGYKDKLAGAEALDIKAEPLSKSWPAPDYEALIESGVDSFVVAFIRAARDSIPRKPTATWKLKSWAGGVELLRDTSRKLIDGELSAAQAKELLQKAGDVSRGMRDIAGRIELYQLVGHRQSLDGISLSNHFYSLYKGKENVNLWAIEKEAKATAFSNMPAEIVTGPTKQEVLDKFKALYDKVDFNKKADRAVTFDLYSQGGKFYVGKKMGRNITQLAGPFDTIKETRAYRDEHHDELVTRLEKAKEIPNPRRDKNEPRVGEDMRDGQDVTPEMFAESFGFKGVEFGNWVEQKKRQKDLNESFDALMDMAAILNIPPKSLSLNGQLGLAFGARGAGGIDPAAAHYERDFVVINLTKKEGAGSLGHEWFHALDNYFSRLRGKGSDMITEALDVSLAGRGSDFIANTAVRKEMIQAFGRVVGAIKMTALRERSAKLDNKRSKAYWTTTPEMSARAFESYLISRLQDQNASNDYLANIVDPETWKAAESLGFELDESYPYPTAGEMPLIREAFDKFFQTVETKETDSGVMLYNQASRGNVSPADKAIYGMAAEGKSAAKILKFIASASRSPFYRQLAKLLLKTGIAPQVMASTTEGWRFNAGNDKKYAAAYNESTNTIALFRPAAAERNFLHEAMHAATIRALGRKGLASGQMKALFEHVKKNGNLKGMYGMSDIDEFVAEAFSNPKFQEMLKKVSAPQGSSTLSSAWHWFTRIVKGILGLPANQENALSQALEIGLGVMREDADLRKDEKRSGAYTERMAKDNLDPDNDEAMRVQAAIEGKSSVAVAQWISKTGSMAERMIAAKVLDRLQALESAGVNLKFKVAHVGDSIPRSLLGARGVTSYKFGKVDPSVDVWINGADVTGKVGTSVRTVLHELVHAATMGAIRLGNLKAANGTKLANDVSDLYDVSNAIISHFNQRIAASKAGKVTLTDFEQSMFNGENNALRDVHETLAWALTDAGAQAYLESIPYKSKSAWTAFVAAIRKFLSLPPSADTALSEVLRVAEAIMSDNINDMVSMANLTGTAMAIQESSGHMMRENMKLSESGGDTRYALSGDKSKPKQTDSSAFRKWFGDSKVVDANREPLVVYHGTNADFSEFKTTRGGEFGPAVYFTDSPREAGEYGEAVKGVSFAAPSAHVMPMFVRIENPYTKGVDAFWKEFGGAGSDAAGVERAKSAGYDGVIAKRADRYYDNDAREFVDRGNTLTHYIAFDKSQAKSAIGNNGDFDGSNPDIRYNVADDGWSVSEPSKMDDLIYALQDKQIDMKRVVQSIMRTGKKVKDEVNAYLQEELFHGRAAKGVKDFLDFELRPLLKQMQEAKVDMGDFEEYLWNRHAEERNKQIAKINPDMPDGGSGIETAKARAYLAGLSAEQRKTFEALAAKVEAMNRESQRVLVESGLEKQSTIDAWNGAYQHYVPLQRDDVDSGHVGTGKGFSVRGSSSKRAMGSGKKVVDIIANLTMQRERNIVRAEKNRVSNALLGLAVQNPNPDFWKVDQAPKERVVQEKAIYTVLDSDGNKIEEFTRMDEAERLANKTPGASIDQTWGDRVTERVMPGFTSRDNVLLTRINGEDHYVIFNERDERAMRMATAMKNLDMDNLGRVLSVVGKATRYLASINTQYNPVFGVINLIRDAQGALINLSSTPLAGEQKRVLGYTKDALVGIYKDIRAHRAGGKPSSNWAALFEEFQKEGGQTGYRDQYANAEARAESIKSELEQFKDGKAKQLARGLFGWLSDYNETMENAVRLAAYKAAKEKGMSNQQAASLAKNITVNFNRKGQMATQVGALYAFFNASVQGTARIAETLFDQHGGDIKNVRLSKKGKQILAGGIMLGAMQALLLAAAGFDDDEPPEFIRERNLILPIGGGKYLTLAMPLGLHVIPGIGRIATEFVLSGGKDPLKRIAAFGSMFADAFNPIGSAGWSLQTITPSVVDPFAALAENKDFTGKEIYREDFNKLNPTPGHARAKDVATFYSRAISEALNFITGGSEFKPGLVSWSPDSIDYLIGQVTGGVGREANKALQTAGSAYSGEDLPLYKIPLVGRFVGDTAGQSGQSQKFYDAIKQINMHEAQYKGLIKDGRSAEAREYLAENPAVRLIMAGNHAELAVRKLRTMKRDLVENDADQDKIRAIDARITETMRRFNERAGAFI